MRLRDYADAGVADLLDRAADVVAERGLCKGVRLNPANGAVDLIAALAIAGGADPKGITGSRSLTDTGIPSVNEAVLVLSVEVLDAILGADPEEWSDSPLVGPSEVQRLLRQAANRLRIAVL